MKQNNRRLYNLIALAVAGVIFAVALHSCGLAIAVLVLWILATPRPTYQLRDDNVDSELLLNTFLDAAITAFRAAVMPLTTFASTFRNVQLKGTDKAEVIYYPLDATAAKNFTTADGYIFDEDTNTAHREITINKRKYVSLGLTGRDLARIPVLDAAKLGALKGQNLAFQIVQDILSIVTHANYPHDGYVGSTFDSDNVVDIRVAANDLQNNGRPTPWPEAGRGLVMNPTYDGKLLKDTSFKAAYAIGTDQTVRTGQLPNVFGFNYAQSAAVPDNGENLVGFAAYMSAVLVAFSPIEPPESVRKLLIDYRVVTDPDTGISFEYRQWGDPNFDIDKRVVECNYGFAKGEGLALLPIRSAASS